MRSNLRFSTPRLLLVAFRGPVVSGAISFALRLVDPAPPAHLLRLRGHLRQPLLPLRGALPGYLPAQRRRPRGARIGGIVRQPQGAGGPRLGCARGLRSGWPRLRPGRPRAAVGRAHRLRAVVGLLRRRRRPRASPTSRASASWSAPREVAPASLALRLLAANGITAATAALINRELPDYVDLLAKGEADTGFLVLAAEARTIQRLLAPPTCAS